MTEYIWFNGHPVAQVDGGTATHWTFTDHLGTPLIQTTVTQAVWWRAEYEPYGRVFAYNPTGLADQHQPLRLPGQEAEQLNLGQNGATERSYNIFRWYRPNWGRYTQSDPLGQQGGNIYGVSLLYAYSEDRPLNLIDLKGLFVKTVGCSVRDNAKIQFAAGQAEAATRSCLNCRDKSPGEFQKVIRNSKYYCLNYIEQGAARVPAGSCGADVDGNGRHDGFSISFTEDAFERPYTPFGCGCLQGILLHEVSHNLGYKDNEMPNAWGLSHKCFSCAKKSPID